MNREKKTFEHIKQIVPAIALSVGTIFATSPTAAVEVSPTPVAVSSPEIVTSSPPDFVFAISSAEVRALPTTPGGVWVVGDSHGQFEKGGKTHGLAAALAEEAVNMHGVKLMMQGKYTSTDPTTEITVKSDAVPGQTTAQLRASLEQPTASVPPETKIVVVTIGTNDVWTDYPVADQMRDLQVTLDILKNKASGATILLVQPPTQFVPRYGVNVESKLRRFRMALAELLCKPGNENVRLVFEQDPDGAIPLTELNPDDFQTNSDGTPDIHMRVRSDDPNQIAGYQKVANILKKKGLMRTVNPKKTYLSLIFN